MEDREWNISPGSFASESGLYIDDVGSQDRTLAWQELVVLALDTYSVTRYSVMRDTYVLGQGNRRHLRWER